jgi:hypothetical protein
VPGPVFVEIPVDILYPIMEVRASMGLSVVGTFPRDIP